MSDELSTGDLTIVVPLHGASRWVDVVSDNLSAAPRDAHIVLSDRTLVDDALAMLRRRHGGDPLVRFVSGDDGLGWREHVNGLIEISETPLFTILPQDDAIHPGYYELLVDALRSRPGAGLAFPRLVAVRADEPDAEHPVAPMPLGRWEPWREAIELDERWNLGVPWRGVVRRRHLFPMLPTPGDRFADLVWVFGIALATHLVEVQEAVYRKRYHRSNTHLAWAPLPPDELLHLKLAEADRRLGDRPDELAAARAAISAAAESAPRATID